MFTIGADVEVFGRKEDYYHVALCGKIGGSKDSPKQIKGLPKGYMVQEDNVALEYNIPPTVHKDEFINSISIMRKQCDLILKPLGLEVSNKSSFVFSKEELSSRAARMFGCEPDYNAWRKIENEKPVSEDPNLRTCGGHVHVGSDEYDMVAGVKAMDLFLGVPSLVLDNSIESKKRRELYGKAGAMRPKPYGWEYRVLSNFWMFSDELAGWVFDNTRLALDFSKTHTFSKKDEKQITNCINSGDEKTAMSLIHEYGIPLLSEKKENKKFSKYQFTWESIDKHKTLHMDNLLNELMKPEEE